MKYISIRKILDWNNLEKTSKPMTPVQIKAIGAVLTKKGVGSIICPKCNILNLVRDSIFHCHCGFLANIVDCACDCGGQLLDRNIWSSELRRYIDGHRNCGSNSSLWKDGKHQSRGYCLIFKPDHHYTSNQGYVFEHRLVVEDSRNCCLLPWADVHHRDGNKQNNVWYNLWPMMRGRHTMLGGPAKRLPNPTISDDRKCSSNRDVAQLKNTNSRIKGKWAILDGRYVCVRCCERERYRREHPIRKHSIDYGQTCLNCNSKHVIRNGIRNNKHRFKCGDCNKFQ